MSNKKTVLIGFIFSVALAVGSGLLAGLLGVIPGVLLLLTMGANFATVQAAETPVTVLFDMLDMKWLYIIFEIVLFGTLIETGTGFIKAVADRIEAAAVRHGKELPKWGHPVIIVADHALITLRIMH